MFYDFMKDLILGPGLYLLCFLFGMIFKRYVIDVIKNYIINKLSPGIIQTYLEDALGMNVKKAVPKVAIVPLVTAPTTNVAPVIQAAAPVVQAITPIVMPPQEASAVEQPIAPITNV